MPARKTAPSGIGRPLAELRADVARMDDKMDGLLYALARLSDATAALLAHAVASPLTAAPGARQAALVPSTNGAGAAVAVPRGTNGHARPMVEEEGYPGSLVPADRAAPLSVAFEDAGEFTDEPEQPLDLNAQLAAELAQYAIEDEEPPPPPTEGDMFDQWSRRIDMFRQQKMWLEGWGPRPGQEGCLAPPELIQGRRR